MSNVCIVYSSTHHGNTEKVLYKIKEKYPETVTQPEQLMQGLKKRCVKEPNKTEKSAWVYSAVKVSIPSAP